MFVFVFRDTLTFKLFCKWLYNLNVTSDWKKLGEQKKYGIANTFADSAARRLNQARCYRASRKLEDAQVLQLPRRN